MDRTERLDQVDLQLLRTLQENARLTVKELASQVNLSTTPVFERLKRLEQGGYIKKYVAILDAEKLNQGFVVFCNIKMMHINNEVATNFMQVVKEIPQITECYNISGGSDYLLKIHASDMRCYRELILNVLGKIDNLSSIESLFVMDEIKQSHGIPF